MKKYGLNELREMFLSFFETKGHLRLPSFSLIPQNDASLLLINSGMAPMKPYFKGEQEPPRHRVCTCQKCIRTGDIENIGKTARHGTYFEMLGNFSFGDYFKHEAIAWSWEFLTSPEWVGLDPDRLYPSIYVDDDEAFDIWNKEVGIPAERIFRFGKEDNFWEHGAGPCGPCSEIYFDRGEKYGCGKPDCTVGCDCDRYIEVWNNVFSQFDNDGNNNYTELKQKNIDTGMGLERLAVVCQDVDSLFDVDTVMNITHKVSELTGAFYGQSKKTDVSLRVITDHIRSSVFMICDGVLPSNEGRGYVLRRLLRRAARHGKLLGMNGPFLYEIIDTVVHENECQYPELKEKENYIIRVVKTEEENFARTIDSGMKIFSEMLQNHKADNVSVFSGEDAFKLYDTYGFPIDLTIEMCDDAGFTVDEEAFKALMNEQRTRAREARKALGDLGWAGTDLSKEIPETIFDGYSHSSCEASVLAILKNGEECAFIEEGEEAIIVLDKTVLYAEMGGQVSDKGTMQNGKCSVQVNNVQKSKGGKYLHYCSCAKGSVAVGDVLQTAYDLQRRAAISRAHSATHLLQKALVDVLGDHVHQAGSYVDEDTLRFDFTHFSAVTAEQLAEVEHAVNNSVLMDYPVTVKEMDIAAAKATGATALFGEKYGNVVRVVDMGGYSIELCGGTHLTNTAKVGSLYILSECSVASGVRRIEAVTGLKAYKLSNERKASLQSASALLKVNSSDLESRINALLGELRDGKKRIDQYKAKELVSVAESLISQAKEVSGLKVNSIKLNGYDIADIRQIGDIIRDKDANAAVLMAIVNDGKVSLLCVCGKNAVSKGIKAGDVIKAAAPMVGGKGGGKPDSAMGGGSDPTKLGDALEYIYKFVESK